MKCLLALNILFFLPWFSTMGSEIKNIPLTQKEWKVLKYKNILSNKVSFSKDSMKISVSSSAGPIIYPLKQSIKVKGIQLDLKVLGSLKLNPVKQQGEKGQDDFIFRIGLVYSGEKRLNWAKRLMAPDWVKELYALAKEDTGIDSISFYNVYSDKRIANSRRTHPYSELLIENFVIPYNETINTTLEIQEDKKVLAIWISCDGDDTGSQFKVDIQKIGLIIK